MNNVQSQQLIIKDLGIDKKDLIPFFHEMRTFYASKQIDIVENNGVLNALDKLFENYEINKLDIKRMYRYLDKNVKKIEVDELEDEVM